MFLDNVSRKQAFLTHLAISLGIFFIVLYYIVYVWYPGFFFHVDGGIRGIVTIFFVDVVLGPGLTLLVFKPGKPSLKFDLSMIALFQAVALTWGVINVHGERPALAVFYDGRISCLNHNQTRDVDFDKLRTDIQDGPLLAILRRPDTYDGLQAFMFKAYESDSAEIYIYGDRFEGINPGTLARMKTYTLKIDALTRNNPATMKEYQDYLDKYPDDGGRYRLYPLSCRYTRALGVFDFEERTIVDIVDIPTRERAESSVKLRYDVKDDPPSKDEVGVDEAGINNEP